MDKARHFNF